MNVVRRFFGSERGPKLWKWAALQTLFIWLIGAALWLVYDIVHVTIFAGFGMALGIVGAFILFIALATKTFFLIAITWIVDFLSFSVPLGGALHSSLGLLGAVLLIGGFIGLDIAIRKLDYQWGSPIWQTKIIKEEEVNETGLEPKLLELIHQSNTKQ